MINHEPLWFHHTITSGWAETRRVGPVMPWAGPFPSKEAAEESQRNDKRITHWNASQRGPVFAAYHADDIIMADGEKVPLYIRIKWVDGEAHLADYDFEYEGKTYGTGGEYHSATLDEMLVRLVTLYSAAPKEVWVLRGSQVYKMLYSADIAWDKKSLRMRSDRFLKQHHDRAVALGLVKGTMSLFDNIGD